ncbi:DUF3761 domain-containing protein [uncultured Bacteroides sp.]|uniref:DUF3761 domain-containing protein n=1 Tax=uncultured Bacteroides sp. TaxID=162156 RepID=UPI002AABFE2E|nr:DUF3761 domain-containing protein [uncultured Bacteroides sp.]
MRKILLLFVLLVFVFSLNAQNNTRYTTCNLNMRSQANTASEVILVIPQGTSVTIDEDCDCKWIPITYNGQIGYVSTKYLSKEKTSIEVPYRSSIKYYTNSCGEKVQSPTRYKSTPTGATALCRDGTYSFSQSRRGTCSHHGGVTKWL